MIKYIQVFGLECSGTNILQVLCGHNFQVNIETDKFGSKHGAERDINWELIEKLKNETLFVYVQKEIFAWIVSVRDTTHGAMPPSLTIPEVLRYKWTPPGGPDHSDILSMRSIVINLFDRIKSIVPYWETVKHIDLVTSAQGVMETLQNKYNPPLRYENIDISPAASYKGSVAYGTFIRQKYYMDKEYLSFFSKGDFEFIRMNYDLKNEDRL